MTKNIDQVETAQWFGAQDYIDKGRIRIYGGSTTIHPYTRMTDFILENL